MLICEIFYYCNFVTFLITLPRSVRCNLFLCKKEKKQMSMKKLSVFFFCSDTYALKPSFHLPSPQQIVECYERK